MVDEKTLMEISVFACEQMLAAGMEQLELWDREKEDAVLVVARIYFAMEKMREVIELEANRQILEMAQEDELFGEFEIPPMTDKSKLN